MSGRAGSQDGPSLVGTTLGGYRLVEEIGRGGMGAVYSAQHSRIVRRAAVKVLLPKLATSPEALQRFFAEARAASMIEHPGIVEVFDCDVDQSGLAFIVMEHLDGLSLARFLRGASLARDLGVLVEIGSQIAAAMSAAHERGIVHRDLKPDNVFLCQGSPRRVKLLDFGIAKLLAEADVPALTREGFLVGTPRYMSPEQCSGARDIGPATDIYSLGCILFQMACGRVPFEADSVTASLLAHIGQPPPAPRSVEPGLPPALDQLILQMLAKEPGARPSSMQEVAVRLQAIGHGLVSIPSPPEPAPELESTAPGNVDPTASSRPMAGPRPRSAWRPLAWMTLAGLLGAGWAGWYALDRAREAHRKNAAAGRSLLEQGLARLGEVAAPPACVTSDLPTLARLTAAFQALQPEGGAPDSRAALAQLEAARAHTPEEWAMLARAHLAASDDAAALTAAQRALDSCPTYAAAHYLAGKAADRLGRRDQAAAEYRRALELEDGFIPPRYNLALLQLKGGDSAGAAATLDEVVARRPDPRALLLRGQARLNIADLAGAEADLREVVRLEPTSGDGWMLLGTVHVRRTNYAEATRAFCRAKTLGVAAAAENCRE